MQTVTQAVILAAGESSRFWPLNKKHKSLIKIAGKPLIWRTIEGLRKSGIQDIIVVQGPKKDIDQELKDRKIKYIIQPKPQSTGDAVWRARHLIKNSFLVLGGHKVDIADYLPLLLRAHKNHSQKIILTGAGTKTPGDFGIIRFKNKKAVEIVENPGPGQAPSAIKATESYIFPKTFFDYLGKTSLGEESLIAAINAFIRTNGAEAFLLKTDAISLKYPWDLLPILEYVLKKSKTKIYIGKNCQISPRCHLRGPVSIGDNCRIGNSVEIKNSIISDGSKVPHLSYAGDSIIGENCNLGAGTITANVRFDKKTIKAKVKGNLIDTQREKFGCVLGGDTQTGINVSLMPGVLIGSNCVVGPAALVAENLEDNTRFFAKFNFEKKSLSS